MNAWYVVHTKPQAEAQVEKALSARGFATYLPLLPPGRSGRSDPLFPTYLFVTMDLQQVGLSALQWIPGVRNIVSFAGRPAVVPEAAMDLIRHNMAEIEAAGGLPKHRFVPGEIVIITDGPLAGLSGIFQGPVGPADRVRILISLLGHSNRAEVDSDLLRKAGDDEIRRMHERGTRGRGRQIRRPR